MDTDAMVRVALFRDDSMDDFPYRPFVRLVNEAGEMEEKYYDKPKCTCFGGRS